MLAERIYVMKNARITETGTTEEIFTRPRDEYTKKLLKAAGSLL
jgi:ABC-type dipeptide/oligopeptide/nickel transport system ATPase component